MRFHTTIRLDGKTATGIEVPADVLASLGSGKRPKVQVTLNGYTYASTVGSMGGRSLIPVRNPGPPHQQSRGRAVSGGADGLAATVVRASTLPGTAEGGSRPVSRLW